MGNQNSKHPITMGRVEHFAWKKLIAYCCKGILKSFDIKKPFLDPFSAVGAQV